MQADDRLVQQIDALAEREYSSQAPGAVILLAQGERVLYRRAIGMADLELAVPMAPDMMFRIASLTKPFTAQVVLLLAEEGKLRLDDPVGKFISGEPPFSTITIEQLLAHTSGLVNYTDMPEWWAGRRQDLPVADLIALFKDRPLVTAPGTAWAYNNSGYALLGAIIETLTGGAYGQYVQQRICAPLGLQHTWYEDASRVIPGRVRGYQRVGESYQNPEWISNTQVFAAGGLVSCADDLARWGSALFDGQILSRESMQRSFTPHILHDGSPTRYGFGWFLAELQGIPVVEHLGSLPGFAHYIVGIPSLKLIVAVLSNRAYQQNVPEPLARAIMELAFPTAALP
jgi:D-alanyl-D-alanine carboxypeptidase